MSKVYVLNTILKSVLWLCLCCAAPAVMAENSPLKEEAPCGVTISGPSVKDACPDQEANLRGGPYQISFTAAGSGGGPYSYSWTVVNGGGTGATNADLSNANTATVTFDTKDLGYGTITLRCTVTGTCSGSSTKDVTVNTHKSPNTHAGDQWKCTTNPGGYAATWDLNSEVSPLIDNGGAWSVDYYSTLSNAVNDVSKFTNPQASNYSVSSASTIIYARIENAAGCWLVGAVPLKVRPAPSVDPEPEDATICPGSTTEVNGHPTGGAGDRKSVV